MIGDLNVATRPAQDIGKRLAADVRALAFDPADKTRFSPLVEHRGAGAAQHDDAAERVLGIARRL